jgi:hypothetical protein
VVDRRRTHYLARVLGFAGVVLAGCGDGRDPDPSNASDPSSTGADTEDSTAFTLGQDTIAGGTDSESDGSSDSGTDTDSESESATDSEDSEDTDDTKWDLAQPPDGGGDPCEGGGGLVEFSYLWVANSNQGTVSKINTQTMQEEARYLTRPDGAGNPSRTSVNLDGDMVVANRNGGVTMIRARPSDCLDANNTSAGPNDIRPWPDGCVEWYAPGNYTSQRPVAWTQGTLNLQTCRHDDAFVWTSGTNAGDANSVEVVLLDGATGNVEQVVPIPEIPNGAYEFGLYGAAVDGAGNLWASQLDIGYLVNVSLEDFTYGYWQVPEVAYGMTVDHLGRAWTCNARLSRFDPDTEEWTVGAGEPGPGGAGCMEDGEGRMWVAGYAITAVDVETMELIEQFPMPVINNNPDTGYGRGISIDHQGYVWSPSHWSNAAYRLDPDTGEFDSVTGLVFPYTYSDMTGFALSNAGVPAG